MKIFGVFRFFFREKKTWNEKKSKEMGLCIRVNSVYSFETWRAHILKTEQKIDRKIREKLLELKKKVGKNEEIKRKKITPIFVSNAYKTFNGRSASNFFFQRWRPSSNSPHKNGNSTNYYNSRDML